MMQEYVTKCYQPAADAYRRRAANGARLAGELAKWQERVDEGWKSLRFGRLMVSREDESWRFTVEAYLGDLLPEDVNVELYAEPLGIGDGDGTVKVVMDRTVQLAGSANGFQYSARVSAERLAEDYTPRIVPYHPEAFVPKEDAHILWLR
jgi:starch phosphorylase